MTDHYEDAQREQDTRGMCFICGKQIAVAANEGGDVCSEACDIEARCRVPTWTEVLANAKYALQREPQHAVRLLADAMMRWHTERARVRAAVADSDRCDVREDVARLLSSGGADVESVAALVTRHVEAAMREERKRMRNQAK